MAKELMTFFAVVAGLLYMCVIAGANNDTHIYGKPHKSKLLFYTSFNFVWGNDES